MRVFGARMLDTGTNGRNTLRRGVPYLQWRARREGSDHHDWAYFEIDRRTPTKMIPIPHPPNRALQPTKVVFRWSQANSTIQAI